MYSDIKTAIYRTVAALLAVLSALLFSGCDLFSSETETSDATVPETVFETDESRAETFGEDTIVFENDGIYSYDDLKYDMTALAERHNGIFTVSSIGLSADGRDILLGVLGNPDAERQIIVTVGMHGREYLNCYVIMLQVERILDGYYTDTYNGSAYSDLFGKTALYILPMCNPDGVSLSQFGIDALNDKSLRAGIEKIYESDKAFGFTSSPLNKYLSYWKANAQGVDINRNFDSDWNSFIGMEVPCFMDYKGTAPLSSPEARAIADLTVSLGNPIASVCIHSSGSIIYENDPALAEFVKNLTGYTVSTDKGNLPSYSEWCYKTLGIPSVTIETGSGYCPFSFDKYTDIDSAIHNILPAVADFYK